MSKLTFNDETLMAFADGELDAASTRAVQEAALADPRIAQRIALFKNTARLAHDAMPAPVVPDALMASVQAAIARAKATRHADAQLPEQAPVVKRPSDLSSAQVTQAPARARPAANQAYWALCASFASIGLGVVGFLAGRHGQPDPQLALTVPAGIVLTTDATQLRLWQNTLAQVPSGQERELASSRGSSARMGMLASFRDSSGALCREFSWAVVRQPVVAGVACQDSPQGQVAWRLAYAAAAMHMEGGYAPASASSALDAYVKSIGGGALLNETQERDALGLTAGPQK
jgi:anti-sigma factor RsiW